MILLNTEKVHADIVHKKSDLRRNRKKTRKDLNPDMLFRAMPFPLTGFRLTVEGQSDRPNPSLLPLPS